MVKVDRLFNILFFIWVSLWAINLFGAGTDFALFGGILLIAFQLLRGISISAKAVIIFVSILFYGVLYSYFILNYMDIGMLQGFRELFLPPTLFLAGYLSLNKSNFLNSEYYKKVYMFIALFLFIYAIINLIVHLNSYGEVIINNRMIYDIWTSQFVQSTAQGTKLVLAAGLLSPLILTKNYFDIKEKILVIVMITFSFLASLEMANRSIFLFVALVFIITLIYTLLSNREDFNRLSKILFTLIFISVVGFISYQADFFDIKTIIQTSNFSNRINNGYGSSILDDPRLTAWGATLTGMFKYPLGGMKINLAISSPHNFWLEIAYRVGIVPFLIMLLLTIKHVINIKNVLLEENFNFNFKVFLFSTSLILFLSLMTEPILSGHYYLFEVFMLQLGMIQKMSEISKHERSKNNVV